MKRINTLLLSSAFIIFSACNKEIPAGGEPDLINITASIQEYTKAGNLDFDEGDNIGLYIYSQDNTLAENIIGTKTGDRFQIQRIYWPESGNLDFYAYYPWAPWGTESDNPQIISHMIITDQSSELNFSESDLMTAWATDISKTAEPVQLTFKHRMSLVDIQLLPGDGLETSDLQNARVTVCELPTQCNVDIVTGEVSELSYPAQITPHGNNAVVSDGKLSVMSFLTIPQTIPAGTLLFSITTGNMISGTNSYNYITSSDITLEGGYRYQFDITLVPAGASASAIIRSEPR